MSETTKQFIHMKAKFGAIVVDGRGKAGGHVFSKNRGGAYMRTKVTPSNPQTASQSTVRQTLATFAQGFRSLTSVQIAAWNAAVSDFKKTDIFGDVKNPSGLNLYVKLNANLAEAGASALTTPPLPDAVVGPTSITLTGAAGTPALAVAWTGGAIPADTAWIVSASQQLSPGVSAGKGKMRQLQVLPAADTTPTSILSAYNAKFGTLVAGRKIFVEIVAVNTLTGQKSPAISTSAIVAA